MGTYFDKLFRTATLMSNNSKKRGGFNKTFLVTFKKIDDVKKSVANVKKELKEKIDSTDKAHSMEVLKEEFAPKFEDAIETLKEYLVIFVKYQQVIEKKEAAEKKKKKGVEEESDPHLNDNRRVLSNTQIKSRLVKNVIEYTRKLIGKYMDIEYQINKIVIKNYNKTMENLKKQIDDAAGKM